MVNKFRVENEPDVIHASAVVWMEGLRPRRVVIRKLGENRYVTHVEVLDLRAEGDVGTWVHESYCWGHYFEGPADGPDELPAAVKDFEERSRR